jgi:hypothetical protein
VPTTENGDDYPAAGGLEEHVTEAILRAAFIPFGVSLYALATCTTSRCTPRWLCPLFLSPGRIVRSACDIVDVNIPIDQGTRMARHSLSVVL